MILTLVSLLISAMDAQPMRPGVAELHPCNAAPAQPWVGRRMTRARVSAAMRAAGAGSVRVIRPGDRISMDYITDRLNVEIDRGGRIQRLYCG